MKIDDVKNAMEIVKQLLEEQTEPERVEALNMAQRCMLAVIGLKEEYGE